MTVEKGSFFSSEFNFSPDIMSNEGKELIRIFDNKSRRRKGLRALKKGAYLTWNRRNIVLTGQ